MVITETLRGRYHSKPDKRIIFDYEITPSEPFKSLSRTASGGVKFHSKEWDEFDNESELIIVIEGPELEVLKEMFTKGLI